MDRRILVAVFLSLISTCLGFQASPLVNVHPELQALEQITAQEKWRRTHDITEIENLVTNFNEHIMAMAQNENVVGNITDCVISLMHFAMDAAHKKPYALQALDAFAKPPSGIQLGNLKWSGRFDECRGVKSEYFNGKWCALTAGQEVAAVNSVVGFSAGLCLPDTCPEEFFNKAIAPHTNNTNYTITLNCPVQPREQKWSTADILSLFVFCLLLFLVMLGSTVDFFVERKRERDKQQLSINADEIVVDPDVFTPQNPPFWMDAAASFSVIKNTQFLLTVSRKPGTIDVLHGMRFLSITWVALGHLYVMTFAYFDNMKDGTDYYISSWTFQVVGNATFSVDSFFFFGGLLVAYLGLEEKYRFGARRIPMMYLQRYLRLTPTYAFMILFSVGFFGKLTEGPYWPDAYNLPKGICVKYWWTNLLYINNLYPNTLLKECYALGWYLANDTQFFILAPFSLLLLKWRPKVGFIVLLFGLFSSILVTGVINSHYNLQTQPVGIALLIYLSTHSDANGGGAPSNHTNLGMIPPMSAKDTFWSDTYSKPWCRIGVYLVGMMTGYILHATKFKLKMSKPFAMFGWLAAAAINMSIVFGLYPYVHEYKLMDISLASFYNAMSRPMWAVGLAWVVIACSCGYGGPINAFLSWSFFVPLSRLTFCFYLVHTIVLTWWFGSMQVTIHFSNLQMAFFFMALVVSSLASSYVLYVLVEMPFVNLSKKILNRKYKQELVQSDGEALLGTNGSSQEH